MDTPVPATSVITALVMMPISQIFRPTPKRIRPVTSVIRPLVMMANTHRSRPEDNRKTVISVNDHTKPTDLPTLEQPGTCTKRDKSVGDGSKPTDREATGHNYTNTCNLVGWCTEPSQPQRITPGLKTAFTLSPSYSFHRSLYHKPCFFFLAYLYSGRVTYFTLRAYTGTMR